MKTALTLFLLLMTTTGCALPLKLLQALLPAAKPVPDVTRYPKTILRDIVPGQKIDWVGNDTVVFAGYPVKLFAIELPSLFEANYQIAEFFREAHELSAFSLLGFLVIHILAVIRHRFFDKPGNDVLNRMI
jgi:hypothetical protein